MAEYLVSVPDLGISDALVEALWPSQAAREAIDGLDSLHRSLCEAMGVYVQVKDESGQPRKYRFRGSMQSDVEEIG
jgi:hypothetical protein